MRPQIDDVRRVWKEQYTILTECGRKHKRGRGVDPNRRDGTMKRAVTTRS
jgi:hypothetical protein